MDFSNVLLLQEASQVSNKQVLNDGVQWDLKGVQIDEITGKTLMVDHKLLSNGITIAVRIAQ